MKPVPEHLIHEANRLVLKHLSGQSAHGDLAEQLLLAAQPLGDCASFCPDSQTYQYVAVHSRNLIFGYATGMSHIAFRLNPADRAVALASGGVPVPALPDWVAFELFRTDWPQVDLQFWARKAYVAARASDAD